jgi:hypothetical protein
MWDVFYLLLVLDESMNSYSNRGLFAIEARVSYLLVFDLETKGIN